MATGTVKWFSDDKGFGFVARPTTQARICSSITAPSAGEGYKSLAEGAKVLYDAEAGDKGPKAVNVRSLI
jgi:cold shock protein